jgi:hypothetical protein
MRPGVMLPIIAALNFLQNLWPGPLAPLDKLSVEGEAFQKTPTVTVTRSASHREGWLQGADGIPTN